MQVFGEFLEYMYSGSIHLNNTSVLPVLTLADKYNIHDLGNVCKQYMAAHCHASLANLRVSKVDTQSNSYNSHELDKVCK